MRGRGVGVRGPGDAIRHPIILAMLVLWAVNDHVLKSLFANGWTGKLSDVAGLAVFPLIPFCAYEIACAFRGSPPRHARTVLLLSLLATGTFLIGVNTSETMADAFRIGLGAAQWPFRSLWSLTTGGGVPNLAPVLHTVDPTDLWTLPALLIPWAVAREGAPETV